MSISRCLGVWNPHTGIPYFCKKYKLRKPIGYQSEIFPKQSIKKENSAEQLGCAIFWCGAGNLLIIGIRYKVYLICSPSIFISESWAYAYCSKIKIIFNVKYNKTKVCAFLKYLSGKTFQKDLSLSASFKEQTFIQKWISNTWSPLPFMPLPLVLNYKKDTNGECRGKISSYEELYPNFLKMWSVTSRLLR